MLPLPLALWGGRKCFLRVLLAKGWRQQEEKIWWLYHERGVTVERSTVSRTLRRRKGSRKALKRISRNRSEALCKAYVDNIRRFTAEDLAFLDESI
jgi:hypothetical protein